MTFAMLLFAAAMMPDAAMVERYIDVCGWMTDVKYTEAQRAQIREHVHGYWRDQDQKRMATVRNSTSIWEKLRGVPEDVRLAVTAQTRPAVLVELQKDAASPDSAFLYKAFLQAHPPLAHGRPGSVPLTKDVVDAALDMEYFVQGEILRRPGVRPPDAGARAKAYVEAARGYVGLTAEQQMDLAKKPGQLAMERGQWNRMGPQLQAITRAQMGGRLTAEEQAAVAQFQNMGRNHMQAMVGNELRNMQTNSDLIMGRGTTWNSTLGRWEQHGGIKTEYDSGVVRVP